jgi:hypothetical protein
MPNLAHYSSTALLAPAASGGHKKLSTKHRMETEYIETELTENNFGVRKYEKPNLY